MEPEGRNTAPATAIAALLTPPEAILLVMPSDHVILYKDQFHTAVARAAIAVTHGKIVTFGVSPRRPETGYGYIRYGTGWTELPGVYDVEHFVEKPNLRTAQQFLAEGSYLWNSGLFVFRARDYLEELEKFQPGTIESCRAALKDMARDCDFYHLSAQSFCALPSVSIDNAIMQYTQRAAVVPVEMGWSDVGSWSTLWEMNQKDSEENVLHGKVLTIKSSRSYVYSEKILTVVYGVIDLIVVITKDACLIMPRDKSQEVGNVLNTINFNKNECNDLI